MICSIWLLAAILLKVIHGHVVNICRAVCCALLMVLLLYRCALKVHCKSGSACKLQLVTVAPNGLISIVPLIRSEAA
jgi:hypothetical protein